MNSPELLHLLRERAISASTNGILITDAQNRDQPVVYVNPGFEKITGYSSEEVIGRNCRFLQGSDRHQPNLEIVRQTIQQGTSCQVTLRNYRKDGTLFWMELSISPVYNDLGELTNFIGIQNDISERFLAESKLQESEKVLRVVLSALKDGITFSDYSGHFVVFNQEMEHLTGYSMLEANNSKNFIALIHTDPQDLVAANAQIQKLKELGQPCQSEITIHTKFGEVKHVLVSTSLVSYQGEMMFLSAYRDITERKQAEEKLWQKSERERLINAIALRVRRSVDLKEILQNTVDEVRQFLQTDRVLIYKFQAESNGEIVVESVVHPSRAILRTILVDDCFSQDYLLQYPLGRTRIISDMSSPELDPCYAKLLNSFDVKANLVVPISYGTHLWGLLIAHQCTEPRQWQAAEIDLLKGLAGQVAIGIRQAELLQNFQCLNTELEQQVEKRTTELRQALAKEKELGELKSRFVAMASHEFRTPLATIQVASDLLKHYSDKMTPAKKLDRINKIQNEVRNMTELLEDVLTIGKVEAGKVELKLVQVNLEDFCREVIEEFNLSVVAEHSIEFSVSSKYNLTSHIAVVDTKLMRQVIINLLSNAIKYSPHSYKVVHVQLSYDDDAFSLSFQDHGIGIPAEDLEKIFDSFHRAQNVGSIPGTGLGLAIAKASVDLHGGTINIDSQVNTGTTISVTIPNRESLITN
jgi:PAS domain S-box-containing protein